MLKKILIYVCLCLFFLPGGAGLATINKASAATKISPRIEKIDKTKLQPPLKTPNPTIDSKIAQTNSPKLAELISIKGLKEETYLNGERVVLSIVLNDKTTSSVWAKINTLDPTFPISQQLRSQGSNTWQLMTPLLSRNLNVGSQIITIFAQNQAGITQFNFIIGLEQVTTGLTLHAKTYDNNISLTWSRVKSALSYVVTYKDQKSNVSHVRTVEENNLDLTVLNENTTYEIQVTALGENGFLAQSVAMSFPTGKALESLKPNRESGSNIFSLKPTITPEAAVSKTKIVQNSTTSPTITATPTPLASASPATQTETPENSWNRWLVALAILVIAIGAAIGGYYGYEWYSNRANDDEPEEPKSHNRW